MLCLQQNKNNVAVVRINAGLLFIFRVGIVIIQETVAKGFFQIMGMIAKLE